MNRLTFHIWLRNALFIIALLGLITWVYLVQWLPEFGIADNTRGLFVMSSIMTTFGGILLGMVTNIQVGYLSADKEFTEDGWALSRIIVHVPGQPDTIITEGVSSTMLNAQYYQTIIRGWVEVRNRNPEAPEVKIQLSAGITPVTYVFIRGTPSPQTGDDTILHLA